MPETAGTFRPVELLQALVAAGAEFILIGGLAAAVHGSPYATADADVVPRRDRSNLERLSAALRSLQATVYLSPAESFPFAHEGASLEDALTWNLATVHGGLDLTFMPAGTEGYADLVKRAVDVDFDGVTVKVAALEDIIRSKEAANREKDRVVLPALRRLLELQEG